MRLATIYPPELFLRLVRPHETYFLFLTDHVLKYGEKTYAPYIEDRRRQTPDTFVVLDSMAFENAAGSTFADMRDAMRIIKPDLVVLPDKRDASTEENYELILTGLREFGREQLYSGHERVKYMAVPHAASWLEYADYARKLSEIPDISFLGIYEETHEKLQLSRSVVVRSLSRLPVHFHMLGMTETLEELTDPFIQGRVFGCDSAKLAVWGYHGHDLTQSYIPEYPGRKDFLNLTTMKTREAQLIQRNVDHWTRVVSEWTDLKMEATVLAGTPVATPTGPETAEPVVAETYQSLLGLIQQLETLLVHKGTAYNGAHADPYQVLTWTKQLGLPEYVGAAARLADKFSRWENALKARWVDGQEIGVLNREELSELTLDLAGYSLLFNEIYRREKLPCAESLEQSLHC